MVQLGSQCSTYVQSQAAGALLSISLINTDNKIKIAAAGAIAPLVTLLGPQISARVQGKAARALSSLAADNSNKVKIAAAGSILPLVALLGPQNTAEVQMNAANTLWNLALDAENQVLIRSAGGIAALTYLSQSTTDTGIKSYANAALDAANFNVW